MSVGVDCRAAAGDDGVGLGLVPLLEDPFAEDACAFDIHRRKWGGTPAAAHPLSAEA